MKSESQEGRKVITKEVLEILKKDIPELYLEELISTKISVERPMRPVVLD